MDNREDLPRVSVGSVQDWQQVRSKYMEVARSKVLERLTSKNIPHESQAIIAHLDQYIERMFILAQPNLRVNGNIFEFLDESGRDVEPFDETLDRRIWSLAKTRLQWHKLIAESRRTVPVELESNVMSIIQDHRELDLCPLPSEEEFNPEVEYGSENTPLFQVDDSLKNISALIIELDQTVSQQHERGDRVKAIAAELNAIKP